MGRILHIDKVLGVEYNSKRRKYPTVLHNKSKTKTIEVTDGEQTVTIAPESTAEISGKHNEFTYKVVKTEGGTGNAYLDKLKGLD